MQAVTVTMAARIANETIAARIANETIAMVLRLRAAAVAANNTAATPGDTENLSVSPGNTWAQLADKQQDLHFLAKTCRSSSP